MAELTDISNEFIRQEIAENIERPDELTRAEYQSLREGQA
jgi:hypothetical protein